jgi:hypothetical protein
MTRNGRIYGPATWERPTGEKESGLWRTPIATDGTKSGIGEKYTSFLLENDMVRNSGSKVQLCLREQVRYPALFPRLNNQEAVKHNDGVKLFPISCAQDYKHREPNSRRQGLPDILRSWPAPVAGDYKDGLQPDSVAEGQLSAIWVEALIGYPGGWTDRDTDSLFENRFPNAGVTEPGKTV